MKRILIPTDFSKEAENAIQTGLIMAKAFDATIVLLHVLEITSKESVNATADAAVPDKMYINEGLKLAQTNLNRSITLHGLDKANIGLERYIRIGSAIKQIEETIEKQNIDLLIMGTKAAWGLTDILLGTSTDKILRRVNCPVLSVNQVVPIESLKNIVFPTTTKHKEQNLIGVIKKFQKAFNSKINLVSINTPSHFTSDKESLEMLEDYANDNGLINYQTHVYSHTEEEYGIREFADYIKGGVITLSTSAHTGLWKIIQGSVTKELVSHSKRPVLTMKMD
jgi:nucleotide-binding universal stress UspA family protein